MLRIIKHRIFVQKIVAVRHHQNINKNQSPPENPVEAKKLEFYSNQHTAHATADKPPNWNSALPFDQIPGPKPVRFLGNIWRFFPIVGRYYNKDIPEIQRMLHEKYGNVVMLEGLPFRKPLVHLFDVKDFETFYRNEGTFPIRDFLKSFTYYRREVRKDVFEGCEGLAPLQGEDWFKLRSPANPILLKPRNVLKYVSKINATSDQLVGNIGHFTTLNPDGEMPEDFNYELYKWALESIGYVTTDTRLGCLNLNQAKDSEAQKLIECVQETLETMFMFELAPFLWTVVETPMWKRHIRQLNYITDTVRKHVKGALVRLKNKGPTQDENELSILEQLITKINEKGATVMALDSLVAGIDTTGRTLAAALYYLAKNPLLQNKLRREIFKVMPQKDSIVTRDGINNTPYVTAAIKETLRLTPIAIGTLRTTVKDLVFGGYRVPKGTQVITTNLILCRSEKHFVMANEYMPERFLYKDAENILSSKRTNPFVFQPFGFGPRACIGKRIAYLELEIALMKIIRNFEVSWPHGEPSYKTGLSYGISSPLKFHMKPVNDDVYS